MAVFPPEALMVNCPDGQSNGTFAGELLRQNAVINCERADKAALRAWSRSQN